MKNLDKAQSKLIDYKANFSISSTQVVKIAPKRVDPKFLKPASNLSVGGRAEQLRSRASSNLNFRTMTLQDLNSIETALVSCDPSTSFVYFNNCVL